MKKSKTTYSLEYGKVVERRERHRPKGHDRHVEIVTKVGV